MRRVGLGVVVVVLAEHKHAGMTAAHAVGKLLPELVGHMPNRVDSQCVDALIDPVQVGVEEVRPNGGILIVHV